LNREERKGRKVTLPAAAEMASALEMKSDGILTVILIES
jgi:hypothetical protein